MRIISNFKDYYDSMQQYGKDDSIVFPRISQYKLNLDSQNWNITGLDNEIKDEALVQKLETSRMSHLFTLTPVQKKLEHFFSNMETQYHKAPYAILQPIYTVINGQAFRTYMLLERENDGFGYKIIKRNPTEEETYQYIKEHSHFLNNYSAKNFKKLSSFEEFVAFSHDHKKSYSYQSKYPSPTLSKEELLKIHEEVKNPIYYVVKGKVLTNIPLVYFGLTNLFSNTEMLYQEIAYCLGNIINNKNEPPAQISNDMKIEQHGFDYKASFRHRK